ncbi:MAG: S9 family peptidase [Acidobacteriia bacterium]|nr:S9 family peptidase [Terriglobia bacterium]
MLRSRWFRFLTVLLFCACAGISAPAQMPPAPGTAPAPGKELTVERIWGQPSLSGQLLNGLAWSPDGQRLVYFQKSGAGSKESRTELWVIEAASGERRLLLSAEKLAALLPPDSSQPTQATGLGRRAPARCQWSPQGDALLFDGPTSLVWYDLKTQSARPLVSGKEPLADPKISPDGRWVSFVRGHNLWLVSAVGGEARAFTTGGREEVRKGELDWVYPEELDSKTAYWWSPDSSAIAYLEMDERAVTRYPMQDFSSMTGEIEWMRYPKAGGANPIVHVYAAALAGGAARVMDTGAETDIYLPRVEWLPDGKRLAIQRLNRAQNVLELLFADAASGASRVILKESDPCWINLSDDLYFFSDGKSFLWSSERSGFRHLYLYNVDGTPAQQLTRGDWAVLGVTSVDEAGKTVYFTATEKSPLERHLYRVKLDGTGFARITREDGTHSVNFAPAGNAFVDTFSNTAAPPRQDLLRADGTRIAALNENKVAELAEYKLSPVEFTSVTAQDGTKLNAMLIKPPDFDPARKYPVLVYTYGGPGAQVVVNAWGNTNFLWHQMMAQKGYVIFAVDNRGSTGRGHAFETPIHLRMGRQELADQRVGVAWLRSQSWVDSTRIGIWGWSYGGHMTLHLMFEAGELFKAGFSGAPVTDWRQYDTIYTERYMSRPQENAEGYLSSSPITHAEGLRGKLLIAHGTGDDNVHFANTMELLNELIANGKYAEVAFFPGRGHPVSDPPARIVLFRRITQFFLDNL